MSHAFTLSSNSDAARSLPCSSAACCMRRVRIQPARDPSRHADQAVAQHGGPWRRERRSSGAAPHGPRLALDECTMRTRERGKTIGAGLLVCIGVTAILTGCGGSTIGGPTLDASATIADAGAEAHVDAGDCLIAASNYDQSCSADFDCVTVAGSQPVGFGDYCQPHCLCGGGAINKSSAAEYAADVARTPLGSGAISGAGVCPCPPNPAMGCCQGGQCVKVCSSGCSGSSPCVAGTNGCPGNGSSLPAPGDPCSPAGTNCYGYGTLSCPATLTCSAGGTWQVHCPAHPFGTDSGSCACSL
jgi:hypothetical protein